MVAVAVMLVGGCSRCNIMSSSSSNSLACAPLVAVAILALPARPIMDARERQQFKSRRRVWTLGAARKVGNLELPAGAVVYLYLNAPEDRTKVTSENIDEIQWRGRTPLFGLMLESGMKRAEDEDTYWQVHLSENQQIHDWPCASGNASFWNDGTLRGCRLYAAREMSGRLDAESSATQHTLPVHAQILLFEDALEFTPKGGRRTRMEFAAPHP